MEDASGMCGCSAPCLMHNENLICIYNQSAVGYDRTPACDAHLACRHGQKPWRNQSPTKCRVLLFPSGSAQLFPSSSVPRSSSACESIPLFSTSSVRLARNEEWQFLVMSINLLALYISLRLQGGPGDSGPATLVSQQNIRTSMGNK